MSIQTSEWFLSHFSLHGAFFSTGLPSNLSFAPVPTPFVWLLFCNSCYYRSWSAVIAKGKIGPDGVLLCMNARYRTRDWIGQAWVVSPHHLPAWAVAHTSQERDPPQTYSHRMGKWGAGLEIPRIYWSSTHSQKNKVYSQFELTGDDTAWACKLSL